MKKIVSIITILLIIVGIIYWNSYTTVRTFDMDGYLFTSDNITNNLVMGNDSKEKIEFLKVKYDDSLYSGRGNYYIGDSKKIEVNLEYPVVSSDSKTLLILSDKGKLIDSDFRRTNSYSNTLVSDCKLFNENDYERADNISYLFLELNDSVYVNLAELNFKKNDQTTKIPVNSFISFSEEHLRYYYLKNGKYRYKEINGLDDSIEVKINKKKYTYTKLLEYLGLFIPEEDEPEIDIAPVVEKEEVKEEKEVKEVKEEEKSSGEVTYVKPTISFGNQKANVYSVTGKLEITDPTGQIVKYPTFEFWRGKTLVARKTFVNSDTIEVKGLYPDSEYEVIGTFNYKNENGQEVKSEFTRFKISTKDISNLESVDAQIEKIVSYSNYAELNGVGLNNKASDEVLKGIRKVILVVGSNRFQLGSAAVSKMVRLEKFDYSTSKSLKSNTMYDVDFEFYDVAGNQLKVSNGHYEFRTTRQAPSGSLAVVSKEISKVSLRFDIVNKDDIEIENAKKVYMMFNDMYKKDYMPKDTLSINHREVIEKYMSNQALSIIAGSNFINMIKQNAPDIYSKSAISPQLQGSNGAYDVALMNLIIPKRSKHQDLAYEFAKLLTNEKNQLELAHITNVLPANKYALNNDYFKTCSNELYDSARCIAASQLENLNTVTFGEKNKKTINESINSTLEKIILNNADVNREIKQLSTLVQILQKD